MGNGYINLEDLVIGNDVKVKTLDGNKVRFINFDNAASTPPFKSVIEKIVGFSEVYSGVHRGAGYKSFISTETYEAARKVVANFLGAEHEYNSVIFVKNSTEAINKLANSLELENDDIVISTLMEHHSNDLPWRRKATVEYIDILENGELNLEHFEHLINKFNKRIKLVAVTGASNVTGAINPIHKIAELTHSIGAKILVDASQLIPHRKIDIKPNHHKEHIDFIVFSAHKIYAPFGIGVLIGPKEFFNSAKPDYVGGGTVKIVTQESVVWHETPEKDEAGTPNTIGAIALASALETINKLGWEQIEQHENGLLEHCLNSLKNIEDISIFGNEQYEPERRLGVISFNMKGIPHSLLAAILSYEYGIGVRNGCFCAHPYVLKLLNVDQNHVVNHMNSIMTGDKSAVPGLVRVSFGLYNTLEEVQRLIFALTNVSEGKYYKKYEVEKSSGAYYPIDFNFEEEKSFSFI